MDFDRFCHRYRYGYATCGYGFLFSNIITHFHYLNLIFSYFLFFLILLVMVSHVNSTTTTSSTTKATTTSNISKMTTTTSTHLVIVTGNPGVIQLYLYPYPRDPYPQPCRFSHQKSAQTNKK